MAQLIYTVFGALQPQTLKPPSAAVQVPSTPTQEAGPDEETQPASLESWLYHN